MTASPPPSDRGLRRGGPGRRWLPPEQRIVSHYVQRVASGRFGSLRKAVEPCRRALERLRRAFPPRSRPPVRTVSAVFTRLSTTALAASGGKRRRRPKWTSAERDVIDRYVRVALKLEPRSTFRVAQECLIELRAKYRGQMSNPRPDRWPVLRTFGGLYSQFCRFTRRAGRVAAPRGATWTGNENALLDRHAAAVFHGRVSAMRDAARSCLVELERLRGKAGFGHRRTLDAVEAMLKVRLEAMGQPVFGRFRIWSDRELVVIRRFARKVAAGHPGGALALAGPCCKEVNRLNAVRLGMKGSVPPRYRRSRAGIYRAICRQAIRLGRVVPVRWKPGEAALAEECAREVYGRRTSFPRGQLVEVARRIHDVLLRSGYTRTVDACIAWLAHRKYGELPWRPHALRVLRQAGKNL